MTDTNKIAQDATALVETINSAYPSQTDRLLVLHLATHLMESVTMMGVIDLASDGKLKEAAKRILDKDRKEDE